MYPDFHVSSHLLIIDRMNIELELSSAQVMNYISSHWPQIMPYLPQSLIPFEDDFSGGAGLCTNPELIGEKWISSRGSRIFKEAELLEGFHCLGIQNRGGSEYLFIMWLKTSRKFWFYDQYVVFAGNGFSASKKRTRKRLNKALLNWRKTNRDVLYSGIDDEFI